MFTGIVQRVGSIESSELAGGDRRLRIRAGRQYLSGVGEGDSIAVNGVCLTALDLSGGAFSADASAETLALTTLGDLVPGSPVNLEKALLAGQALGGHLVTGHVDAVAPVLSRAQDARSVRFDIALPARLNALVAEKGSICVDGVSLTVNAVGDDRFGVNIVPHTQTATIFDGYEAGTRVNLEIDIIARYVARMLAAGEGLEAPK